MIKRLIVVFMLVVGLDCAAKAQPDCRSGVSLECAYIKAAGLMRQTADAFSRKEVPKAEWSVMRVPGKDKVIEDAVEVFYNQDQVAVLHPYSGYFRMVYGPSAGWGTSIVVLPIYWGMKREKPEFYQGANAPGLTGEAVLSKDPSQGIVLKITQAKVGELAVEGTITIHPPGKDCSGGRKNNCIRADVFMKVINPDARLGQVNAHAFKPVFLSSMHMDENNWDSTKVTIGENQWPFNVAAAQADAQLKEIETRGGKIASERKSVPIFDAPNPTNKMVLNGGTSKWKANAPSVSIDFTEVIPPVQFFSRADMTPTRDANDDNMGVGFGTNQILRQWKYVLEVYKEPGQ